MSALFADQIVTRELADGVRFVLPRRELGALRTVGWFLCVFGLMFGGFAVFWIAGVATAGGAGQSGGLDLLMAVFGLPFLGVGLMVLCIGLLILKGHTEVELTRRRLRVWERVGWLQCWSWSRPVAQLRRLVVDTSSWEVNGKPVAQGPLADFGAVKAEFKQTTVKPLIFAIGYPRTLLLVLADLLADRLDRQGVHTILDRDASSVAVRDGVEPSPISGADEIPVQPPDSQVVLTHSNEGLTLTVPPMGIGKSGYGLFSFSIIWLGFMTVFTSMWVFGAGNKVEWFVYLFIAGFWAIGFVILVAAVNMGKRHAIIDVVGDTILITRKNLFGVKQHDWRRGEIESIRCGSSGMEVNNRPVIELQVHPKQGKKVGLFSGRDKKELRWIAGVLTEALSLDGVTDRES